MYIYSFMRQWPEILKIPGIRSNSWQTTQTFSHSSTINTLVYSGSNHQLIPDDQYHSAPSIKVNFQCNAVYAGSFLWLYKKILLHSIHTCVTSTFCSVKLFSNVCSKILILWWVEHLTEHSFHILVYYT